MIKAECVNHYVKITSLPMAGRRTRLHPLGHLPPCVSYGRTRRMLYHGSLCNTAATDVSKSLSAKFASLLVSANF